MDNFNFLDKENNDEEKLISQAKRISKSIDSLDVKYLHILELNDELNQLENDEIASLLNYNKEYGQANPQGNTFIVAPRTGTISPWSSKATDIIHNIGVSKVKRVERVSLVGVQGNVSSEEL